MRSQKLVSLLCLGIFLIAPSGCARKDTDKTAQPPVVSLPEQPTIYGAVKSPGAAVQEGLSETGIMKKSLPMVAPPLMPELAEGELLVADFESWPNNLGGEIGVYGGLEPDWDTAATVPYSWVYDPKVPDYDPSCVHKGYQSFRLVNGLGRNPAAEWGSFGMDLGPTTDITTIPKKVESLDVSGYRYFTFWAKGAKGGERMRVLFRDANALNYMPQTTHDLPPLTAEWQKMAVPLSGIGGQVDLTRLDNIGIAFGNDAGNLKGDTAYVDDFAFSSAE